jgi:CBS-domain-containing membrane protein
MHDIQPVQHIHGTRGVQTERAMHCAEAEFELPRVQTIADMVPLTEIMSRNITCARRDLHAERVAELMVLNHVGCVPVVEEPGRPIGMITKLDVVERLVARDGVRPEGLAMETAATLMMPMSIALKEQATIAHAAALMASEDIHHLCVVDMDGRLIGVVSTMDIVRWLARNDGFGTGL